MVNGKRAPVFDVLPGFENLFEGSQAPVDASHLTRAPGKLPKEARATGKLKSTTSCSGD